MALVKPLAGLTRVIAGCSEAVLRGHAASLPLTAFLLGMSWADIRPRASRLMRVGQTLGRVPPGAVGWRSRRVAVYAAGAVTACASMVSCGGQADAMSASSPHVPAGTALLALVGVVVGCGAAARVRGFFADPACLLGAAVTLLPRCSRERWMEEWQAELALLPVGWRRLRFASSLIVGMPRMAAFARRPAGRREGR